MKDQITIAVSELDNSVKIKELELSNVVRDVPALLIELETGFERLKSLIADHRFASISDEIAFFKEVKPRLFSKLIYYRKIYSIELNKPIGSYQTQILYLQNEQGQISAFCNKNADFIQYYRSGRTHLDEFYFIRGRREMELNMESFYFERDPKFSTHYDFKVAKLLANDMLAAHLNCELSRIKQEEQTGVPLMSIQSNERWTDTKSALVELIYAIHTEGSINSGSIDLKVLAAMFEKMFNIDLGDIYRIFLEIRGRKGERAVYLNKLIRSLNKRMDDADNK